MITEDRPDKGSVAAPGMGERYPEIVSLKMEVERIMGRRLVTPSDFMELMHRIDEAHAGHVGLTTIKRIWDYVSNSNMPRKDTLSVFARFAGYDGWDGFCEDLRRRSGEESGFLDGKHLSPSDISEGDAVEIGWPPNRYCLVRCTGSGCFKVEKSVNAKVLSGDTFRASLFCIGQPLYVSDLRRADGSEWRSYVAGTRSGITSLRLFKSGKVKRHFKGKKVKR